MKRFIRLLSVLTVVLSITVISVFSAEYPENLRVGIYYGSGSVSALKLESKEGFSAGYYSDRSFNPVQTLPSGSITVKRNFVSDSVGTSSSAWHVSFGRFDTSAEAAAKISELSAKGIEGFTAYFSSAIYVLHGCFKNENDASWAAENLLVKGSAFQASAKSLRIDDTSSGKTLFMFDDPTAGLGVCSVDYRNPDSVLTIDGSAGGSYRGGFECKLLDPDGITIVNILPVEKYLYSVVSREMSPSWNIEALKAQAICARNFALGRISYHSKYGFDVCRTTCCQAYSGTASENANVHNAVDETNGELLFYDGKPIQAVYSSSMGSCTESVENVWGTPYPYLVSVENPYEDTENIYNGKWTKTLTRNRATEIMNSRGYDIGDVIDITAVDYTDAGRVLKLKVSGTKGEKIFEREACRSIFSEVTYSQKFTVTKGGSTTYPDVFISDGVSSQSKALSSVSVLTGSNTVSTAVGTYYVTDGKQIKQYAPSGLGGDENTFVFDGEGWGHGVGMSQYGAKGMAEAGFKYNEILTHYYTGTYLEKAY